MNTVANLAINVLGRYKEKRPQKGGVGPKILSSAGFTRANIVSSATIVNSPCEKFR